MAVSKTLITGASAGIGYELARQFAAGGSDLVLAARRLDKLEALAKELRGKYGVKIETVAVDLSVRDARQKLFERYSGGENTVDAACPITPALPSWEKLSNSACSRNST